MINVDCVVCWLCECRTLNTNWFGESDRDGKQQVGCEGCAERFDIELNLRTRRAS